MSYIEQEQFTILDSNENKKLKSESLVTIKEASLCASNYLNRKITNSNISYLVQYGKIKKYNIDGKTLINLKELKSYYNSYYGSREIRWKQKLGNDLNWSLSFDYLREKDTTKHVHRLHPYKGKFIPQLVEYFLNNHINSFKKEIYFKKGDIVLDPFSGSGTTLVQANELDINSIGIDISYFNCLITETKLFDYNLLFLENEVIEILDKIINFESKNKIKAFENELLILLSRFNSIYFPSPEFKYKVNQVMIDEDTYGEDKEKIFLPVYYNLINKYKIKLEQDKSNTFLDKWYVNNVRNEIDYAYNLINEVKNENNKKILTIILSRTIRSCRATTHSDLATLKKPQLTTYYCHKHKKICKPIFSIKDKFSRYATDTLRRLRDFSKLKTDAYFTVIPGDSRKINIFEEIKNKNRDFYEILKKQKIKGIFTSPPYVGNIDYHEQHAYAYELFQFERKDNLEIGPLCKGKGEAARKSYIKGISEVLNNCKKYLINDFDIFIVANDRYNLYPKIAYNSEMKIVDKFKRPVLNRTERDKNPYSEIIFHLKRI